MHPRVLIIGTVPYSTKESSRAFDAYFHFWEKENISQIFSNQKIPAKGHCGSLYQITDINILRRWLSKKISTGKVYYYDELLPPGEEVDSEANQYSVNKIYQIGRKHSSLTHLLRGLLWKKDYWCTPMLNEWLDRFNPDCVFLAFSDDFFINNIALYVSERYDIPIVSCIGDDYYFNKHFSLNPIYQIYKESYKAVIRKVFKRPGSAIYISDKIRDKYNKEFNLNGETVYLTSSIERKPFSPIDKKNPVITYFGNIRMGRNLSLVDIGNALASINPNYCIEVYSNESDKEYYSMLIKHPNIKYCGSIPYAQVQKRMYESDITVIVEGFQKKDIELSRYSLSTKAADALASGAAILTYGSEDCGIVEYMKTTRASEVCVKKTELKEKLIKLINEKDIQQEYYKQQIIMTQKNHNLSKSCAIAEKVISNAIQKGNKSVK